MCGRRQLGSGRVDDISDGFVLRVCVGCNSKNSVFYVRRQYVNVQSCEKGQNYNECRDDGKDLKLQVAHEGELALFRCNRKPDLHLSHHKLLVVGHRDLENGQEEDQVPPSVPRPLINLIQCLLEVVRVFALVCHHELRRRPLVLQLLLRKLKLLALLKI